MADRLLLMGTRSVLWFGIAAFAFAHTDTVEAAATSNMRSACPAMSVSDWGVLDYRTVAPDQLQLVEKYHFTPEIERLGSLRPGKDISYTLRRFQNHHRALMSIMKLGLQEGKRVPTGAEYSVDCYLERAEALFPDDAVVRMIHGLYQIRTGRPDMAVITLETARSQNENNANLHYNLGLAYLELKKYDRALQSAHRAYALGFPLPGLRNRLKRAGKWHEVTPR